MSGLEEKSEMTQVSTLLYRMSDKADLLAVFSWEDLENFDLVKARFDRHFMAGTNVIYERAKFNHRCQAWREFIDSFFLTTLAKSCDFAELEVKPIRDNIVVGCRHERLSENLQKIPDLALEGAVNRARQNEAIKSQQKYLRSAENNTVEQLNEVSCRSFCRK